MVVADPRRAQIRRQQSGLSRARIQRGHKQMGNHGAVSTRARAGTVNNRASNSTDVNSFRSRALNLSDWPVSRRLFAVIVVALLMGLIFGGLRVASAESSAAQFGRVSQLATLGQRLTVLIQDLQNERDATLSFLVSVVIPSVVTMTACDFGAMLRISLDRAKAERYASASAFLWQTMATLRILSGSTKGNLLSFG